MDKKISKAVINRLPRYYRYLGTLEDENVERISSSELSERMHVTASQIRQDLNNFGGFGQQGYGYNVSYLRAEIAKILGLGRTYNMVIVGAGNIGRALIHYRGIEKYGYRVIGIFDNDPSMKGEVIDGTAVQMVDELAEFIANHKVDIGVLTVPKEGAKDVAKALTESGVKALWNFTHTDLEVGKDVFVENVHLSESLMRLSYNFSRYESGE